MPSARELHVFYTPQPDEVAWARGVSGSGEHLLALLVWTKCFGRLGYFPALADVPVVVVEHVRRDLGLAEGTVAVYASARTAERHRDLVRRRLGVVRDPAGARKVAAEAIREASTRKNNPPDLINIALERLVEGCFELPGFSTLDQMASTIRGEVNAGIFAGIAGRAGPAGIGRLEALLEVSGPTAKSDFNRLKKTAPRPSWTNFRVQLDHLRWVDGIGDAPAWVAGDRRVEAGRLRRGGRGGRRGGAARLRRREEGGAARGDGVHRADQGPRRRRGDVLPAAANQMTTTLTITNQPAAPFCRI